MISLASQSSRKDRWLSSQGSLANWKERVREPRSRAVGDELCSVEAIGSFADIVHGCTSSWEGPGWIAGVESETAVDRWTAGDVAWLSGLTWRNRRIALMGRSEATVT
jgi:hypothetical protein